MAQSTIFSVTATKVITPQNKIMHFPSGKDWTVVTYAGLAYTAIGNSTLILTGDGFQIECQEEYADLNTTLSATDATGS